MKDFMRLIRLPNLIIMAAYQCILHFCVILPYLSSHNISGYLSNVRFILLLISTVCIAAGGNAINDYFDHDTDSINCPDRVVVGRTINRRKALLVHVILTLIGSFCGIFLSFVLRRASFTLLFLGIPIILWLYSTHFKRQMLVGNILVAMMVALVGYMVISLDYASIDRYSGYGVTNTDPCSSLWYIVCAYCIFAFVCNLAREILKDIEDVDGDALTQCHTLPVEMGISYSKIIVILIELFLIAMLWFAYASADFINNIPYSAIYLTIAITIPSFVLCYLVAKGSKRHDYHVASTISKIIMLLGIVTLFFI